MIGRAALLPGVTLLGVVAMVVVPVLRPDRANHPRDAVGQAMMDLLTIEPGLLRDQVDKVALQVFPRPGGTVVYRHPRSECLRIDVRYDGEGGTARVIAVSDPYLAYFPTPRHLP